MFPQIFLKSVCTQNFLCATFYLNSSEFGMSCKKYVQKAFLEGTFMCTPSFLVCARLTTCVHTHSLEGKLVRGHQFMTSTRRGVRLRWLHVDGGGVVSSVWTSSCPHKKLETTDIILPSSHTKKFAFLYQNFFFEQNRKWKFFVNINQ